VLAVTPVPTPTLFVCHGDDGGPWFRPCRRVQEALRAATGTTKLPTLELPDGTVISHSSNILAWIAQQQSTPAR
jgi:hypothetical protein